jgi:hypothetical protein
MRKLSIWARQHPWKARIIIILSHILLLLLALVTGKELSLSTIQLPAYLLYMFVILFITAAFFYPSEKEKKSLSRKISYIKQKTCDFTLAAATFGMVVCISNEALNPVQSFYPVAAGSITSLPPNDKPTAQEILASLKHRDKSTLTRSEKRILKQELKEQLKVYVNAKLKGNKSEGGDAGLIILAIVGALGLLYVVAVLACNLSCNGSEGAAVTLAVLGTAAVIFGLIMVIRAIVRKSRKKKEAQLQGGNS